MLYEIQVGNQTVEIPTKPTRYHFIGHICRAHPEHHGLRYKRNGLCVACRNEATQKTIAKRLAEAEAAGFHEIDLNSVVEKVIAPTQKE